MSRGDDFATVLAAAQAGGEWAIALLYRDLQPRLGRYLAVRAGADADDVASETWIAVARNLPSFEGDEDALRGWVFTIARRRLQDHHRRTGRRHEALTDPTTIADTAATPGADVQALDDGALGDEAARRLVASLPDLQADVVLLRIVGGLGVDEVAEIVGKRPGTVRVLQHRALKRLARELPAPAEPPPPPAPDVTPATSRAMKDS